MSSTNPHVNPFYIDPDKRQEWSGGALEMEDDNDYEDDDLYDDEEEEEFGLLHGGGGGDHRERKKRVFHDASYFNSHRGATSNKERRWILGIVCAVLVVITWMALKQQDESQQQASSSQDNDNINKNQTFPYPPRVVLLGERHSGVEFYREHLSRCFAHLPDQHWETSLTRDTTWFQDPAHDDDDDPKNIQFILVVRDPYTWVEAMRQEPLHMPRHERLDWKAFVTTPWTILTDDDGSNDGSNATKSNDNSTDGKANIINNTTDGDDDDNNNATVPETPLPDGDKNATETPATTTTTTGATTTTSLSLDETNITDDGGLDDETNNSTDADTDGASPNNTGDNNNNNRRRMGDDEHSCQLNFTPQQVIPCQAVTSNDDKASPIYELNPNNNSQPFGSILELRAAKLLHYYSQLNSRDFWPTGRPLILVRYEHSLWDSLQHVAKHAGEWGKSFDCHNLKIKASDSDNNNGKNQNVAMEEIDPDYVPYLTQHIHWEAEELAGYHPRKTP